MIVAVIAMCLAVTGAAVAAPSAFKLTKGKVRTIADKEIAKKAPNLSVSHASTADTATTANNANQLGGKSLAQITPVLAGAQNSSVVAAIGTGTDTVQVNYTLAAPSRVNFSGSTELDGDGGTNDEATCVIRNDGSTISLGFETAFDDIGSDNSATDAVEASAANVPAGAHLAVIRCTTVSGGPITKDDAALNIVAVPNP